MSEKNKRFIQLLLLLISYVSLLIGLHSMNKKILIISLVFYILTSIYSLKYIPDIDWSDPRVVTDEGLLEVCGCPKDKAKVITDKLDEIIFLDASVQDFKVNDDSPERIEHRVKYQRP